MASVVGTNRDIFDVFVRYVSKAPRDLFKIGHDSVFWSKYFTGVQSKATKSALKAFSGLFDAFATLDFLSNINSLKNKIFKGDFKNITIILSDSVTNACDSLTWFSSASIVTFGSYFASWLTVGSGFGLMYSFANRIYVDIKDLANIDLKPNEKSLKIWGMVKNISLFAIGVILAGFGWIQATLPFAALTLCSTIIILASISMEFIKEYSTYLNTDFRKRDF